MLGQGLYTLLPVAPVFDAVVKTGQYAGRIRQGFLLAHLRAGGPQIGYARALVKGRHLKGTTGAGGILFKQDDDIPALQILRLGAVFFGPLEQGRQVQQIGEVFGREVQFL